MGTQIVKQPNGKHALWSSIVDNFTLVDADANDIIESFVDDFRRRCTADVNRVIAELERDGKPYHQFTKSFEDCLEIIGEVHGSDCETFLFFGVKNG